MADPTAVRNRRLVHAWYERLWNAWDASAYAELLEPDLAFRGSLGTECRGVQELAAYVEAVRTAFPDFHNTIEEIISEGDRAFARLTYRGTHRGEAFGVAPTGRSVRYAGAAVFRFRAERIAEVWVLGDVHGLLRQLTDDG